MVNLLTPQKIRSNHKYYSREKRTRKCLSKSAIFSCSHPIKQSQQQEIKQWKETKPMIFDKLSTNQEISYCGVKV